MAPKLSDKDAPCKKKARKSITLEQKMDILRRYDRGQSTAAIHKALNLPESTLHTIRKDREKITASVKVEAGSCSTSVVRPVEHHGPYGENVGRVDGSKEASGP